MAEFCLDCWNRINKTNEPASAYILSRGVDLCEGCGQYKRVIVVARPSYDLRRWFHFPKIRLKKQKDHE